MNPTIATAGDQHAATGPWPIHWGAIWVGALAALTVELIFGLAGIALGAHQLSAGVPRVQWDEFSLGALAFSVFGGAFFSCFVGGWVTGKIARLRQAETAMLHGAIAWLVAVPLILALAVIGAAGDFAGYGGLASATIWTVPAEIPLNPESLIAIRNAALGAVTALLLGLVGGVVGGWLVSGERTSWSYSWATLGRLSWMIRR